MQGWGVRVREVANGGGVVGSGIVGGEMFDHAPPGERTSVLDDIWLPSSSPGYRANDFGLQLPESKRHHYEQPVAVSLFAGIGGFDLGLIQAGYHVIAANEYDAGASETYLVNLARWGHVQLHYVDAGDEERLNKHIERGWKKDDKEKRPHAFVGSGWIAQYPHVLGCEHFWFGDCKKLTGQMILDSCGLSVGDVDCVTGGPPCQGFSLANKNSGPFDPRNSLVFEFIRLVLEMRPKTMVLENVPQLAEMLTPDGVPVIDAISLVLAEGGWSSFNALRKSLLSSAGAGAAIKGKENREAQSNARKASKGRRQPAPVTEELDEEEQDGTQQLALFDDLVVVA